MNQYFAKEGQLGLTAAKAQRLCVLADKALMDAQAKMSEINFVSEEMSTFGFVDQPMVTKVGDTQIDFDEELKEVSELTALLSYLHEAIKEKENRTNTINDFRFSDYCREMNIPVPDMPELPSLKDAKNDWEPEKLARYYKLKSDCAIYQKLVGKNSPYEKAMQQLLYIRENPISKEWRGDKLYITSYKPSVSFDEAKTVFDKYQRTYSQLQAEVNALDYEAEQATKAALKIAQDKYQKELDEYKATKAQLVLDFTMWKDKELEKVRNLKIRIPDNLVDVFNRVRNIGAAEEI